MMRRRLARRRTAASFRLCAAQSFLFLHSQRACVWCALNSAVHDIGFDATTSTRLGAVRHVRRCSSSPPNRQRSTSSTSVDLLLRRRPVMIWHQCFNITLLVCGRPAIARRDRIVSHRVCVCARRGWPTIRRQRAPSAYAGVGDGCSAPTSRCWWSAIRARESDFQVCCGRDCRRGACVTILTCDSDTMSLPSSRTMRGERAKSSDFQVER